MKNTSTVSFPFLFFKKWEQLHPGYQSGKHISDSVGHQAFVWPSFSFVSLTLLFSKRNNSSLKVQGVLRFSSDQSPIPGINIAVKGTEFSTSTDQYGKFSMQIPNPKSEHSICFSFESIPIYESEKLSTFIKEDFTLLGEKVAVGKPPIEQLSMLESLCKRLRHLFTSAAEREIEKYFRSV